MLHVQRHNIHVHAHTVDESYLYIHVYTYNCMCMGVLYLWIWWVRIGWLCCHEILYKGVDDVAIDAIGCIKFVNTPRPEDIQACKHICVYIQRVG